MITSSDEIQLSFQQQEAFDSYQLGENIFITGPGGSGKSALIREIIRDARERGKSAQVCAMTGTAAVLLQCNAKTIHSWGGIGLANGEKLAVANKVNKSRFKKKNWKMVDLLIVDEVSMMSVKIFELLEMTARLCRKNTKPFGGIQVIFTGDFYQLPPVGNDGEPETVKFCFESPIWKNIFTRQIQLKQIFRQDDPIYKKILNQIRIGRITKSTVETLNKYVGRKVGTGEKILPTVLYPTKRKVEAINSASLNGLKGDEVVFDSSMATRDEMPYNDKRADAMAELFSQEQKDREYKYMVDNVNFEKRLVLKEGAQVMCVVNMDMDSATPICNGSQGVVVRFEADNLPIVRFKNGAECKIMPHVWQSETIPSVGIKQIPLILSWAITIHKSQGASLDMAEIDVGSGIFECGQTYVALSRLRSIDGLYLKSFDPSKIIINLKVREFYKILTDGSSPSPTDSIGGAC
jgi:ATP-dependent DNA helicase PIF1